METMKIKMFIFLVIYISLVMKIVANQTSPINPTGFTSTPDSSNTTDSNQPTHAEPPKTSSITSFTSSFRTTTKTSSTTLKPKSSFTKSSTISTLPSTTVASAHSTQSTKSSTIHSAAKSTSNFVPTSTIKPAATSTTKFIGTTTSNSGASTTTKFTGTTTPNSGASTTTNSGASTTTNSSATPTTKSTATTTTNSGSSTTTKSTGTITTNSGSSTTTKSTGTTTTNSGPSTTTKSTGTNTTNSGSSTTTNSSASTTTKSTGTTTTNSSAPTTTNSSASTTTNSSASTTTNSSASTTTNSSASTTASSSATSSSSTTSKSSSTSSTTSASTLGPGISTVQPPHQVLINEVNLLVANKAFFVELRGLSKDVHQNLSVVIFNGENSMCLSHIKIVTSSLPDNNGFGVFTVPADNSSKHMDAIAVALFDSTSWSHTPHGCQIFVNASGLMDVLIISKKYDIVSAQIMETFAKNKKTHVIVIDPLKVDSTRQKYSISRCDTAVMDSSAFILSRPSKHTKNKCELVPGNKIQLKLTDAKCKDFRSPAAKQRLLDVLIYNIAQNCACGLSPLLFKLREYHCGSLIFEAFLEASDTTLVNKMFVTYNTFVKSHPVLTIGNQTYNIDTKCNNNCLTNETENNGNINVTIAVVSSCVAVFLIIVLVVVIYLKRKRRGVLQFRMTRLDEDDDDLINPEMDDFVSGGHDASFENRLYSRFDRN